MAAMSTRKPPCKDPDTGTPCERVRDVTPYIGSCLNVVDPTGARWVGEPREPRAEPSKVGERLGNAWTCEACRAVTLEGCRTRPKCCAGCGGSSFTGYVVVWKWVKGGRS